MQAQEGTLRVDVPEAKSASRTAGGMFRGLGQTTALAASALIGCGMLIALGTVLSLCWAVHPLLTVVAAVPLTWFTLWLGSKLLWSNNPTD